MAKVLVCFGEGLSEQESFKELSQKFQSENFEVHLFDNVNKLELMPYMVFNVLEHVWQEDMEENEYFFLSNIEDFFSLCYRSLHHTFEKFIFWNDDNFATYDVDIEGVYKELLYGDIKDEENLYKTIFVNNKKVFDNEVLNKQQHSICDFFSATESEVKKQQTIYCYAGNCYVLEPSYGCVQYIYLDDQKIEDTTFSSFVLPIEFDQKIIQQVEEMFILISKDMQTVLRRQEILHKLFLFIKGTILTASPKEQKYYSSFIMAMGEGYGTYTKTFALSFLLQIFQKSFYYKRILEECAEDNILNAQQKYFVYTQAKHVNLVDYDNFATSILEREANLFKQICESFKNLSEESFSSLEKLEANDDVIVVFVTQFLNESYPSTLLSLKLSKYLFEHKNKNVFIINTCEYLSQAGKVPFFDISAPNVLSEYSKGNNIEYEGVKLPFIQMIASMPSINGIEGIIEFLEFAKPSLILNISDDSVVGMICANYIKSIFLSWNASRLYVPVNGDVYQVKQQMDEATVNYYKDQGTGFIDAPTEINFEKIRNDEEFLAELAEAILSK